MHKMPNPPQPNQMDELSQFAFLGGALGALVRSLRKNTIARSLLDAVAGGLFALAVYGTTLYAGGPTLLAVFLSGVIGTQADFILIWMQRIPAMLLLSMEDAFWKRRDEDQPPPGA